MVSIKRNTKGEFQEVDGLRVRKSSIYSPGQKDQFKISRSKFSTFVDCQRCFYLDRVKGLKDPSMPGWALNTTVDDLLKKEFDYYREQELPHPIFEEYNLNFIPFQHKDLDKWRNSLTGGISFHDTETNIILQGGIDDVWFDKTSNKIVVADYKAQSSKIEVEKNYYLSSQYHQGYKLQMDIYVYILRQMGFDVSDTTYFMVCNGIKTVDEFDKKIIFDVTLVDYDVDVSWIQPKICEMKEVLDSNNIPEKNPYCEHCAYLEEGAKLINERDH